MKEKKMTKKEKFELILAVEGVKENEELKKFIEDEIAALDSRAAKAKERAEAKKSEIDNLAELVFNAIAEKGSVTVQDIVKSVSEVEEDVTSAKVVSRLTKLYNAEKIEKKEITVDKRKLMSYCVKEN